MKCAGKAARIGEVINEYKVFVEILNETDHLEDLSVNGRIILNSASEKQDGRVLI